MANTLSTGTAEVASETPLQETWRHFKKNRLGVVGLWVLGLLVLTALVGKVFTEWFVVFDPATERRKGERPHGHQELLHRSYPHFSS